MRGSSQKRWRKYSITAVALICYSAAQPAIADNTLPEPWPSAAECPANHLFEPYSGVCAPVDDVRYLFGQVLPDSALAGLDSLPEPGGIGIGTLYRGGTHRALEHAVFHTRMFVQPDGLDSTTANWQLLTPATNHTDSATEFAGIYASHLEEGWFGIFARPCTPDYPCPDGDTANGWQAGWSRPFSEFACNTTEVKDQGGHRQQVMHYANQTQRLDTGSPPLWQSSVYVWNDCSDRWNLFWRHEYREAKRDCSIEGCYRWGPILETFGTQGEINELGYEDSMLFHDGTWSTLSADSTDFVSPIEPWQLLHLNPNSGYGVGNRYEPGAIVIAIDIKPPSGDKSNRGNRLKPDGTGKIWVATLSSDDFDALQADVETVRFGPDEATVIRHKVRDVDKNGMIDQMFQFKLRRTGIECGDTEATLIGRTFAGQDFEGTDAIKTVRCKVQE